MCMLGTCSPLDLPLILSTDRFTVFAISSLPHSCDNNNKITHTHSVDFHDSNLLSFVQNTFMIKNVNYLQFIYASNIM